MLAELNGTAAQWLQGRRKRYPGTSQLIAQISMLAAQFVTEISEIELNPVLVHPQGQGVTIVDALVVRKKG